MNGTRPALLHRPPRWPDESLPSWLIRLAQANFYPSPSMVVHLCRERLTQRDTITRPTRTETYRVLAELTRTPADELYTASVQSFASILIPPTYDPPGLRLPSGKTGPVLRGSFLREQIWSESDIQFCPLCLQQAVYHRLSWMPLAMAVCLHHQCLLVRGCPGCGQNLSIRDLLKTKCPLCTRPLTQGPVTSVAGDDFGLFSQAVLQTWLGLALPPPAISAYALPDVPPPILYRVLDGLRRAIMSIQHAWDYLYQPPNGMGLSLFPCLSKGDLTPVKVCILFATAFKALVNWPHGFYQFIEAYQKRDGRLTTLFIHDDLGYLYTTCLEQLWRHPAFHFVQQAFDLYLLDHYSASPMLARFRRNQNKSAFLD